MKLKKLFKDKMGAVNVGAMIGAIIIVVVGVLFLPIVQDQIDTMVDETNGSINGTAATLMEQVPLFYVLGLVFIALAWAISSAKEM
jgi:hypothetical protein